MFNNLKLERPLAVIDLETTGTRYYADRIVEFSVLKINPDGTYKYKNRKVNPQIKIPVGASNIHGITNEDVENEPTFRQLAKGINEFLEDCDLCGFNILDFDLPLLAHEFARIGIEFSSNTRHVVDTMTIYHMNVPYDPSSKRTLEAAFLLYCGKELKNAHSAEVDVAACAKIIDAQIDMYNLPNDVPNLCKICTASRKNYIDLTGKFIWKEEEAAFNFGKHKGRLLIDIYNESPDYYKWMKNQDFSPEVMGIINEAIQGIFPTK